MCDYPATVEPRAGWGQFIQDFLPLGVEVCNAASSGRSSKSFIEEGRLEQITSKLKPGDFLFIQFGHNDQKEDEERKTLPFTTFKSYLKKYIQAARAANATPVLLTPVQRRSFNENGVFQDTHGDYSLAILELAKEEEVQLIDLGNLSKKLFVQLGPDESKKLFLHLSPDEFQNYPQGVIDDTHFSETGARKIADLVMREFANF